jgi:osmotically-inducible protein OsmY
MTSGAADFTVARVMDALRWHRELDLARVTLKRDQSGRITLQGTVPTYAEKCSIEEIVRGLDGVAGVRNRLDVRITIGDYRTDEMLARVLQNLFESLARMPGQLPRVTVADGWVTLEGRVDAAWQKQLIENAVRDVAGVRGITNRLILPRGRVVSR